MVMSSIMRWRNGLMALYQVPEIVTRTVIAEAAGI
jgi:hypothetical protein